MFFKSKTRFSLYFLLAISLGILLISHAFSQIHPRVEACRPLAQAILSQVQAERSHVLQTQIQMDLNLQRNALDQTLGRISSPEIANPVRTAASQLVELFSSLPLGMRTLNKRQLFNFKNALERMGTNPRARSYVPPTLPTEVRIRETQSAIFTMVPDLSPSRDISHVDENRLIELTSGVNAAITHIHTINQALGVLMRERQEELESSSQCATRSGQNEPEQELTIDIPERFAEAIIARTETAQVSTSQQILGMRYSSRHEFAQQMVAQLENRPLQGPTVGSYRCGNGNIAPEVIHTFRMILEPNTQNPSGGLYVQTCSFDRRPFTGVHHGSRWAIACSEINLAATTWNLPEANPTLAVANNAVANLQPDLFQVNNEVLFRLLNPSVDLNRMFTTTQQCRLTDNLAQVDPQWFEHLFVQPQP